MSISRLPPRTFRPLASSGATSGAARLATPPACQIQLTTTMPFSSSVLASSLPTSLVFHCDADLVARHQRRHQADVGLGHLAAGVGERVQAEVERALPQRRELRHRLHQRRAGIDRALERAVALLLDVGGEAPAEAIAEIALGRRAAGELVRDLEGTGLGPRGTGHRHHACGRHRAHPVASGHRHARLLSLSLIGRILPARWRFAIGGFAPARARALAACRATDRRRLRRIATCSSAPARRTGSRPR